MYPSLRKVSETSSRHKKKIPKCWINCPFALARLCRLVVLVDSVTSEWFL